MVRQTEDQSLGQHKVGRKKVVSAVPGKNVSSPSQKRPSLQNQMRHDAAARDNSTGSNSVTSMTPISVAHFEKLLRAIIRAGEFSDIKLVVAMEPIGEFIRFGDTLRVVEKIETNFYRGFGPDGWVEFTSDQVKKKSRTDWTVADLRLYGLAQLHSTRPSSFVDTLEPSHVGRRGQGVILSCAPSTTLSSLHDFLSSSFHSLFPDQKYVWVNFLSVNHSAVMNNKSERILPSRERFLLKELGFAMKCFHAHVVFLDETASISDIHLLWEMFCSLKAGRETHFVTVDDDGSTSAVGISNLEDVALTLANVDLESCSCQHGEELEQVEILQWLLGGFSDLDGGHKGFGNTRNFNIEFVKYFQDVMLKEICQHFNAKLKSREGANKGKPNVLRRLVSRLSSRKLSLTSREDTLSIQASILDEKSAEIQSALCRAAILLKEKRHYTSSLVFYRKELECAQNCSDALASIRTAKIKRAIAGVYISKGEVDNAVSNYNGALESLGSDDPSLSFQILNQLGTVFKANSRLDEARESFQAALAITASGNLVEPTTKFRVMEQLGQVLEQQGKISEALAITRDVILLQTAVLGQSAPELGQTLNRMGSLHIQEGKLAKAEAVLLQAETIWKVHQDGSYADKMTRSSIVLTLTLLARVAEARGKMEKALSIILEALELDPSPSLFTWAGSIFKSMGEHAAALKYYRQSIPKDLDLCSTEHLRSLDEVGSLLYRYADYDEAANIFQCCLKLREQCGKDDLVLAVTLNALAVVLKHQGNFTLSLTMYERALKILESELGQSHAQVADTLENIALLLEATNDFSSALEKEKRCMIIRKEKLGMGHPSAMKAEFIIERLTETINK